MTTLSVLIVIKNEEKQIEECLSSVNFADEIIVILDKCTDNSERIVKRFTKNIYIGNWNLEGERRNFGLSKCTKDWVLEIDADERVPDALKKEIDKTIKNSKCDWHKIMVKNFLGKKNLAQGTFFAKMLHF